jgi:predicted  nucleic acid-binding Zn-ribbon protein
MTIEISLLIAGISLAFGLYQGVSNLKRNSRMDTEKGAASITEVKVKLEIILEEIREIKVEFSGAKKEIREIRDKMITLEQSLKSAWHIIDGLKKGEG